jgi:NADH-quinone oxidoreductase subunit G
LKSRSLAADSAFVVVQDLFLTETARRADVVLPAACAYEKSGTITNVCGEVQALARAVASAGVKTDLEILELLAHRMGVTLVEEPVSGPIQPRPNLVRSAGDTLFTSGTLGRYCGTLNSVREAPGELYRP